MKKKQLGVGGRAAGQTGRWLLEAGVEPGIAVILLWTGWRGQLGWLSKYTAVSPLNRSTAPSPVFGP